MKGTVNQDDLDELDKSLNNNNNNEVNFGDISQTDYSNSSLVINTKEDIKPPEKNHVSIFKILVFTIVFFAIAVIAIIFVPSFFKKENSTTIFTNVDNWLNKVSLSTSATIDLSIKKQNNTVKSQGTYQADLKKPYMNIKLNRKSTSNEIVLNQANKNFNIIINKLGMFFNSNIVNNVTYYQKMDILPFTEFLLKDNLKRENEENIKINFFDKDIDVKKNSFVKGNFTITVYYTEKTLYRIIVSVPYKYLEVDIYDNKYYYNYYENDISLVSGTISYYSKGNKDVYNISMDTKEVLHDIILELTYNDQTFKEEEVTNYKDINLIPTKDSIKKQISTTFGF